jgi:hypothetical protein
MNREGYIFAPYIIAESINIVSESNTNPIQGISSRYGRIWKSKSEIRIDKIKKILESINS